MSLSFRRRRSAPSPLIFIAKLRKALCGRLISELCQLCGIPLTVNLGIPAIDKLSRQNKWDAALSVGVKQETDAEYPYSVESNIFNGNGEKPCRNREYPVIN